LIREIRDAKNLNLEPSEDRLIQTKAPFYANFLFWPILGVSLCLASTFLPWSSYEMFDAYLPWAPLLSLGNIPSHLPGTIEYKAVGISIRVAACLGWAGVLVYAYRDKLKIMSMILLFLSGIVSVISVISFYMLNTFVSIGFYTALVGGILMLSSALFNLLGIEIKIESEENKR